MKQKHFTLAAAAVVASAVSARAQLAVNGGGSWEGWTYRGVSNMGSSEGTPSNPGVYGRDSASDAYQLYSTVFTYSGRSKTGSPTGGVPTGGATGFGTGTYSQGAFAHGNVTLHDGVKRISGSTSPDGGINTIRFDLDGDRVRAATPVAANDGRASIQRWSAQGDFTAQFEASTRVGYSINVQAGNGTQYGGPNLTKTIYGASTGGGVDSDFPFRAFAQPRSGGGWSSCQMSFDLTAMKALYGVAKPLDPFSDWYPFETVSPNVNCSLNGCGSNGTASGTPVPEPSPYATVFALGSPVGRVTGARAGSPRQPTFSSHVPHSTRPGLSRPGFGFFGVEFCTFGLSAGSLRPLPNRVLTSDRRVD